MDSPRIYLDYNASSLIRPESIESVNKVLNSYGNPSSIHKEGRSMRSLIEDSRENEEIFSEFPISIQSIK